MIVSELIKKLEEFIDYQGDLEVYIVADHGQQPMKVIGTPYGFITSLEEYMPDEIHEDDIDEDSIKVLMIEAV